MKHDSTKLPLPRIVTTRAELRDVLREVRARRQTIGLVPTMGALHEGHLSLVDASRGECDYTVVTIFVNPMQFGPHEDFSKYPRDLNRDLDLLATRKVDLVFAPPVEEVYPAGHGTTVDVGPVAQPLEGKLRPGHFPGVATVVLKLFNLVAPNVAYFGRKDYQQSLVVRRMVADLDLPIEIQVCPTVREPDGLALSSRNVYLSSDERLRALSLSQSLRLAAKLVAAGETNTETIAGRMHKHIESAGDIQLDYIALADPETLAPIATITGPTVALIAARVGNTRLIDNELLTPRASQPHVIRH